VSARAALIVACDRYEDPKFAGLRAPVQDAQALSDVLSDPGIGGFQVRALLNEPAFLVNEEIEGFFADRRRDDLLLLYFTCHGVKDQSGRLYFAARNTKLARLGATGISSTFVGEQMERSASRRIALLLDCCYSGAFARGLLPRSGGEGVDLQERFRGRGRAVITASSAMEYAFEGDELSMEAGQPSVFTSAVVRGLRTGEADRDGDGWVSVDDLYAYVYEQVREATPDQTPNMFANLQGALHLAHNPNPVAPPTALPADLLQAASSVIAWQREGAVAGLEALLASDQPRLAGAARGALQRLADDDSRRVSAAAHAALARSGEPGVVLAPAVSERAAAPAHEAPPSDRATTPPGPVREARPSHRDTAPPAPPVGGDAREPGGAAATREPPEAQPIAAPPEEQLAPAGDEPDRRRWVRVAAAGVAAGVAALAAAVFWLLPEGTWSTSPPTGPTAARSTAAGPTTTSSPPRRITGSWVKLPVPPVALESSGTAAFGKRIWMAGGFDAGRHPSSAVLIYDPVRRDWGTGPALPAPISHAALVSTGRELLLIGGYHSEPGKDTPVAAVLRLRQGASGWVGAPPLPEPLAAGAAAWDGRRVVFAGGVGNDRKPSAAMFALEGGSWRPLGTLSKPREHLAAASDGKGNVWFLAGEAHDPARPSRITRSYGEVDLVRGDSVQRVGTVRSPLGSLAGFWSEATGPCVMGGRDIRWQVSRAISCLDPGVTVPALSSGRHGMGAAVVDGVLYAVGGTGGKHHADLLAGELRLTVTPR
jgi:Caspase domain